MGDGADRKTKLATLRARIVSVAKSDDLLAVARELEVIGQELAGEERSQRPARTETAERPQRPGSVAWPRDMNERGESTSSGWGRDPREDAGG